MPRGSPATETFDGAAIRVLVWNLYKSKLPGWRDDFAALANDHDLLLLQEGYWDAETQPWFTRLPGIGWWLGVTFEYTHCSPHPVTGTVLGSRATPLGPILSLHSPYREALTGTPKSFIAATFRVSGATEPLLAVSVHGTNLHIDETAFDRHMDQVLDRVGRHRGPVVLAGDFNTWSSGRLAYLLAGTAALGLESVFDSGLSSEPGDGRLTWGGHYLDHAFVRGLVVRPGAKVLGTVTSSDHAPLSFVVAIPGSS
ncbi:MAG: endonuclease/exonuclease/phosphatase family protein [Deltaproteobacteria bacterium]|nr:endonuclease/exonuclease/phosphatase family protein [Deltaproteobacteria bacterium]